MPLGERLLRLVERRLLPWFDRAAAEREATAAETRLRVELEKAPANEAIRVNAIAARVDSEKVRREYALMARRLRR